MRPLSRAVIVVLVILVTGCEHDPTPDVQACFDSYKSAILASDGQRALPLVTSNTISYYDECKEVACSAGPEDVARLRLVDKMTIGMMRLRIENDHLCAMSGEEMFVTAVNGGWIGEESADLTIGGIDVGEGIASAAISKSGQRLGERFRFVLEDDQWRLDLMPTLDRANLALQAMQLNSGMTEDEYVFAILAAVTGREVDASVWAKP